MNRKVFAMLVLIGVIVYGCATTKVHKEEGEVTTKKKPPEQEMNIEVLKIYSWINLMPGTEPRFNISGKIKIKPKGDEYNLNDLLFTQIKIKQNGKTVYYIKPTVREEGQSTEYRKLIFSTIKGLSLTPDIDPDKKIMVELIFDDDGDKLKFIINDISIEKVY